MTASLLPRLAERFVVDQYESAADAVQAVAAGTRYSACVAKLGTSGNKASDIFKAFYEHPPAPFIAVHSCEAFANDALQVVLAPHPQVYQLQLPERPRPAPAAKAHVDTTRMHVTHTALGHAATWTGVDTCVG